MSLLTEELKSGHVALKLALKDAADSRRSPSERVGILHRAKEALLSHLEKENTDLYPPLRAAAEHDSNLRAMLEVFGKDMELLAPQAVEFFSKYEDEEMVASRFGSDVQYAIEFGRNLERLVILLGLRIGREERALYPAYDQTIEKKVA